MQITDEMFRHSLPKWEKGELWLPMTMMEIPPPWVEVSSYAYSISSPLSPEGSVGYAATYFNFTRYIRELINDSKVK